MTAGQRACMAAGAILAVGLAVFIITTVGDLPPRLGMRSTLEGETVDTATKGVWLAYLLASWLVPAAIFGGIALARRSWWSAIAFLYINLVMFVTYLNAYQDYVNEDVPHLSPTGYLTFVLVAGALPFVLGINAAIEYKRRTKAARGF
jgi:hypothetical protein